MRIPVAPFVPEAAVRNPTHHWFEVFTEAGIDLLGWGERDARVSDVTGPPGSAESSSERLRPRHQRSRGERHTGPVTARLALDGAVLLLIDVQRGFDDAGWGTRNNEACEANIEALLSHWRARERPIVFVRHDSLEPGSPLAAGTSGNAFKDVITGEPDLLVTKHVNSASTATPTSTTGFSAPASIGW